MAVGGPVCSCDSSPPSPSSPSGGSSRASSKVAPSPVSAVRVFEELRKLAAGCNGGEDVADVADISSKEMDEIRQLKNPPFVVRRTLEAVFLLLNAARAPARPQPPEWPRVQRMMSDAGFLSRMLHFDVALLMEVPVLTAYVATEYFVEGGGVAPAEKRRNSMGAFRTDAKRKTWSQPLRRGNSVLDEGQPLTFGRVRYASRAAAALFRWSALALVQALDPTRSQEPQEEVDEKTLPSWLLPDVPVPEPVAAPVQSPPIVKVAEEPAQLIPTADKVPERPPQPVLAPLTQPSPKARLQPRQDARPDRHFEVLAHFIIGSSTLAEEGEMTLQTVFATYCMRRRLQLQLVSCPDRLENDALARGRLMVAQDWLLDQGFPPQGIALGKELRQAVGEPGVLCQFLLDQDTVLRDFYLMVADGEKRADVGTRDTLKFTSWLEDHFRSCVH